MARTQLEWNAFEYHHQPKSSDWFWAVGIIAISIAVTAIIFGNFLFAIFIIIAAVALSMVSLREPQRLSCQINDRGILIGDTLFPFNTLESFWVEDHHYIHTPKVIIKSKKFFMPYILIPIEEISPDDVRDTLLVFLPEVEHIEPLTQKLMERLGF